MAKQRRIGDQFHAGSRDFSSAFRPRVGPTQPLIRSQNCPDVWGLPSLVSSGYRGLFAGGRGGRSVNLTVQNECTVAYTFMACTGTTLTPCYLHSFESLMLALSGVKKWGFCPVTYDLPQF